jgi:beta-mannosidase
VIRAFCGESCLPADASNPYWRHAASWWLKWQPYLKAGGDPQSLDAYVRWSQQRQAEALAYAVGACRRRFPRCGGFIVWIGHDCFPCPVNTSILDFNGNPKPAAFAIRDLIKASTNNGRE